MKLLSPTLRLLQVGGGVDVEKGAMVWIKAVNFGFIHKAHLHLGEEADDTHFAGIQRGADGAEACVTGIYGAERFGFLAKAGHDDIGFRREAQQMIKQGPGDEGHVAGEAQNVRMGRRMQGRVQTTERAFARQDIAEEGQAKMTVRGGAVGDQNHLRV
jgi:hypothetical protein